MTPLQRLAHAVMKDPEEARRLAERVLEDGRKRKERKRVKPEIEAVERANGRAAEAETRKAAFYDAVKREAMRRARDATGTIRCEGPGVWPGERCHAIGIDPDHVIGGAYRQDCERLGAEGLMILCRQHHYLKHANAPSRRFWLDHAEDHARRIYHYPRLAALVAKARARHEAKHPQKETTP